MSRRTDLDSMTPYESDYIEGLEYAWTHWKQGLEPLPMSFVVGRSGRETLGFVDGYFDFDCRYIDVIKNKECIRLSEYIGDQRPWIPHKGFVK